MFNNNWNIGKVIRAILGGVALLIVAGGLVSCDIGGEEPGGEIEEQTEDNNQPIESDNENEDEDEDEDDD